MNRSGNFRRLRLTAAALSWLTPALAAAEVRITGVTADGVSVPLPAAAAASAEARERPLIRVPARTRRLEIRYAGGEPEENAAAGADLATFARGTRLRHRLDGVDDGWQDPPASGRVFLQFQDAAERVVDSVETAMHGQSPGWAGSLERSPFVDYTLAATAPPRAASVTAHFLSHGVEAGREVVGQIGIDAVVITVTPAAGGEPVPHSLPVGEPAGSPEPPDTPAGWTRRGSWGRIAQVVKSGPPDPRPILALIDDDPRQYGNWTSVTRVKVAPGDTVVLTWRAAHSLGLGAAASVEYRDLPAGTRWFRAGTFRPAGDPTGAEASLGIELLVPWHERPQVLVGGLLATLGLALAGGRSLALKRIKRRLEEVERAHAVERERTRIARDLHDEVGAALTEIAMQQYWVQREMEGVAPATTLARVEQSRQAVVDLVRNVDAIVWAVNPANDTLDRFIPYLTHSVEQFLESAGVAAQIDAPDRPPPLPLEGSLRHGLFLTVREAVNNAVKHGQPATVWLTVHIRQNEGEAPRLSIVVADDGRGLADASPAAPAAPPDAAPLAPAAESRLGIESMRRRVAEAAGWFTIEPRSHGGTAVTIDVPLEPAVSERFRPEA